MVLPTSSLTNTTVNASSPTTILARLAKFIPLSQLWIEEQEVMGRRVARYRKYYDGDHDAKLTKEMKELLRVTDSDDGFAINFCPMVVDTMTDRCIVQSIEGVEPDAAAMVTEQSATPEAKPKGPSKATTWAQEVSELNHFDVIQGDLHQSAIRDGNSYLLSEWDNDKKQVCMYVEPAWDGQTGVLMVYRSHNVSTPYAAIKIWQIEDATAQDNLSIQVITRVNIYYADRVEKFIARDMSDFEPYTAEGAYSQKWDMVDGAPIGIPVVHFRNGGRENYGISELRNAIAPQNALNRFNYSAVMAAELTAFPVYVQLGFSRPEDTVAPGMVIKVEGPLERDQVVDFKKLEGSTMEPLLAMIDSQRRLLSEITGTPTLEGMGSDNSSGESLKQREIRLIGKVRRFTTRAGGSWEMVFDLAHKIQRAYGTVQPPAYKRFVCTWQSPEIRNDAEVVENAMKAEQVMGEKQTLRNVAEVFDLTEEKIEEIMEEKEDAAAKKLTALAGQLPGFNDFNDFAPTPKAEVAA